MIYSVIDLGSNTIRLCVYNYTDHKLKSLFNNKIMAGLANYVVNGKLNKKGIERACDGLKQFQLIMQNLKIKPEKTRVFATASLRNISNSQDVISEILKETGFRVELLSGEEEATLGFKGANTLYDLSDGILIDIGGGSTEIVIFNHKQIVTATSMPIGSLNMYTKYVRQIIPKHDERKKMRQAVLKHIRALNIKAPPSYKTIYGVGGTIRAASKLNNAMFEQPKTHRHIPAPNVDAILNQLKSGQREVIQPITQNVPDRIHTIIPGMIILQTFIQFFNSEEINISPYALREGFVIDRMIKGADH